MRGSEGESRLCTLFLLRVSVCRLSRRGREREESVSWLLSRTSSSRHWNFSRPTRELEGGKGKGGREVHVGREEGR